MVIKPNMPQYLNVNDNAVKEEGAKAIGELMKSAFELKYLNLGCSLLGNEGLCHSCWLLLLSYTLRQD